MNQLEIALSRSTDPLSSHLAADETRKTLEHQKDTVLRFLNLHPNTTAKELASYYKARHGEDIYATIHKRLPDLRRDGKATNGEMRVCRISGRLSQVWSAS